MTPCSDCGAINKVGHLYCGNCGMELPSNGSLNPPLEPPQKNQNQHIQTTDNKVPLPTLPTKKNTQSQVIDMYWLCLILFLAILSKSHNWHHVSATYVTYSGEIFTDSTEVKVENDLQGMAMVSLEIRDYTEGNDTEDGSGYYGLSEDLNQYDYRTNIQVKEFTSLMVEIIIFLLLMCLIIVISSNKNTGPRFPKAVSKIVAFTSIMCFISIVFFTISFTPIKNSDFNNLDVEDESNCVDEDIIMLGTFGFEEYSGCTNNDYVSATGVSYPGLGFIEIGFCMIMCICFPFRRRRKNSSF